MAQRPRRTLASVSADLKLLRDRVDRHQIFLDEEKKPWHRNLPIIISCAALFLSVFSTFWSIYESNAQVIRAARDEVRGIVLKATELENKLGSAGGLTKSRMEQQISVYISSASNLIRKYDLEISAEEYSLLGDLESLYGTFGAAKAYYLRGADVEPVAFRKAFIISKISNYYVVLDQKEKFGDAHKYYDQAINYLDLEGSSFVNLKYKIVLILSKAILFRKQGDGDGHDNSLAMAAKLAAGIDASDRFREIIREVRSRLDASDATIVQFEKLAGDYRREAASPKTP